MVITVPAVKTVEHFLQQQEWLKFTTKKRKPKDIIKFRWSGASTLFFSKYASRWKEEIKTREGWCGVYYVTGMKYWRYN